MSNVTPMDALRLTYTMAQSLQAEVAKITTVMKKPSPIERETLLGQAIHRQRKAHRHERLIWQVTLIKNTSPKWLRRECDQCQKSHAMVGLFRGEKCIGVICPFSYWFKVLQMHNHLGQDASDFLARYPEPKSLARPVVL